MVGALAGRAKDPAVVEGGATAAVAREVGKVGGTTVDSEVEEVLGVE